MDCAAPSPAGLNVLHRAYGNIIVTGYSCTTPRRPEGIAYSRAYEFIVLCSRHESEADIVRNILNYRLPTISGIIENSTHCRYFSFEKHSRSRNVACALIEESALIVSRQDQNTNKKLCMYKIKR